jgi:hypothetical protein
MLSPLILWSALLYAGLHVVFPEYSHSFVSSKFDERSAKLVSHALLALVRQREGAHFGFFAVRRRVFARRCDFVRHGSRR